MEPKMKGKSVTSSKVKIFQNPFCLMLEIINKNYHKKIFFGYHDALKIYWDQSYVVKSPVSRLQRVSAKSPLAPSSQDLLGLFDINFGSSLFHLSFVFTQVFSSLKIVRFHTLLWIINILTLSLVNLDIYLYTFFRFIL